MNNPVIDNYLSRLIYAGIWMLILSVQILFLFVYSRLAWGPVLLDSCIFNVLLSCEIIALWYPIFYNRSKSLGYRLIFLHVLLFALILVVYLAAGYLSMNFIMSGSVEYRNFFISSLPFRVISVFLIYTSAILFFYLWIYVMEVNKKNQNEARLNEIIRDTELNLLKTQINPHFLFNSLNSVNSLVIHSPQNASKMIVALSDFLRYSVSHSQAKKYVQLEDEIENIERYLSIEKVRFGDKLTYQSDIDPQAKAVSLPAMVLQPLVENAVKHGVYESTNDVLIRISAHIVEDKLRIEIVNNFDENVVSTMKGTGTGLRNISERLRLMYGSSGFLETRREKNLFIARIYIPIIS